MRIVRRRLPDGIHGQTDGRTIFVDDRLNAVQMFCTIQHELVHAEMGHSTHQDEDMEMEVRFEAAKRCLPLDVMIGSCRGDSDLSAKSLGVTKRILTDRASTLTDDEARLVGCMDCRSCPAMKVRFAKADAFALGA
jgi:hypothetical protein